MFGLNTSLKITEPSSSTSNMIEVGDNVKVILVQQCIMGVFKVFVNTTCGI